MLGDEFKKIFETENVAIVLLDNNQACALVYGKIEFKPADCDFLKTKRELIICEEQQNELAQAMDAQEIKIIIPLVSKYKTIGFITLGKKQFEDAYSREEFAFLKLAGIQISIALENAMLYQENEQQKTELNNLNKNLATKVDEQTHDIKNQNSLLQKMLIVRSEFLDTASHQLRTPISVIKSSLDMLKEEKKISKEKMFFYIDMAYAKAIKLGEVVDEIMSANEMDSENFTLNLKWTDLKPIIEEVIKQKMPRVKEKNLKLIVRLPRRELKLVLLDERHFKQALDILIINSIQYTLKGSITVSLKQDKKKTIIEIIDTGIGIPKKFLPELFLQFRRAKNATDAYRDGSGLGLYIVKKIINAHRNANVYLKSTAPNKGTAFVIEFGETAAA